MRTLVDTKTMLDDIEAKQADVDRTLSLLSMQSFGGPVEMRRSVLTIGSAAVDAVTLELVVAILPEVAADEAESARRMRSVAATADTADYARLLLTHAEDAQMAAGGAGPLLARLTSTGRGRRRLFGVLPPTAKKHDPLAETEVAALRSALHRIANDRAVILHDAKSAFTNSAAG